MFKRVLWSFMLLLVVCAAGLVYVSTQKVTPPDVCTVGLGNIERLARGSGRVEGATDPMVLSFGTAGYVQKLSAVEGKEIDPEEAVVAELSPSELDVKIAQADATLKQTNSKLELVKAPKPPEVIKQAEERLRQVSEEVKAAESRVKALQDPPAPPPASDYEIAEAARNIERARQRLALAKTTFERLKKGPSDDERAVAETTVALTREKLEGAQKMLDAGVKGIFGVGPEKLKLENAVEMARKELQHAEAERDRVLHGATPFELASADANVKLAQIEVDSAEATKERLEKPAKPKPAAEYVVAEAVYALEQAKARQSQEKAALEQLKRGAESAEIAAAEAAKEHAEKSLSLLKDIYKEGLKLRAPTPALVVKRHVSEGVLVPAFSPIITIIDFSKKRVRAEFDVSRLGEIKPGMKVAVSSKAFKELADGRRESLDGVVERIVSVGTRKIFIDDPSATKGGEVVEVLIGVVEPPKDSLKKAAFELLLPGLRMDAAVALERRDKVLRIPKSYIANDGKEYVLLKKPTGESDKRYVTSGLRDDAFVQIENGVSEGDVLIKPEPQNKR